MYTELDEQYLCWLYARIGFVNEKRRAKTYWSLMSFLYSREFVWLIAHDDNRVQDGRDLRYEFLEEAGLTNKVNPDWLGLGCSVLELILAVAKQLAFEDDRMPQQCFWELMTNLGLSGYNDRGFNEEEVSDIVERFIWRNYEPDGRGGLFPLSHPTEDQRRVEIWYQLNAWLLERH